MFSEIPVFDITTALYRPKCELKFIHPDILMIAMKIRFYFYVWSKIKKNDYDYEAGHPQLYYENRTNEKSKSNQYVKNFSSM